MRYATWEIDFIDDSAQGTVPLEFEGAFYTGPSTIVGYIPDNCDIAKFAKWKAQEVTQSDFFDLAQASNPETFLLPDGRITSPLPERKQ
jgi:hypothetical protein